MVELGQHQELADALIKKRGKRTKVSIAKEIGISPNTLHKLEHLIGNTKATSQYLARLWVNGRHTHRKPR